MLKINEFKKSFEGYNYRKMMRMASLWLPVIAFLLVLCTYVTFIRFFLYIVVIGGFYKYILMRMGTHKEIIEFDQEMMRINNESVLYSDIDYYYTCLPLNKFFMLRITTKANEKKMWYIDVRDREKLEEVIKSKGGVRHKTNFDYWLQYGHLSFAFYVLFLTMLISVLIGFIFPSLKLL